MIADIERAPFHHPGGDATVKLGGIGPFHVGVYTGVRIKTAPGWLTLIDRVADQRRVDSLPFTTETAIPETDWYTRF